ncbi:hypothetical protein NHX12_019372, partial [Muraenolepis orangiensis]
NLEFCGVMRFYLEDSAHCNVATKCVRVSSRETARELIQTLAEKFGQDSDVNPPRSTSFRLHEVHAREGERRLDLKEKPLLVQLSWSSEAREGRLVLRREALSLGVVVGLGGGGQQLNPVGRPQLPVQIQFSPGCEEAFLSAVIDYTHSWTVHFKLSPAYALYAAARSALQPAHLPPLGSAPGGKTDSHAVTAMANKMVAMTEKRDGDLGPLTQQPQLELSHLVHTAYKHLIQCLQKDLRKHLPTFFLDPEQHGALPPGIEMVLNTLMNAMALLRRCRVNPALTIQLFSQLLHFTSAWLFNRLLEPQAGPLGLRSHYWGAALRQRLSAIQGWAERQGLELAADCHLGHIVQATALLTMSKYWTEDAAALLETCFKLNSLQLHALLTGYQYGPQEPRVPPALIDSVVTAAKRSTDPLVVSDGRSLEREESLELRLPFLLPDGGYSCDTVGGTPPGFTQFLEPICRNGLCRLTPTADPHGSWRAFFSGTDSGTPGRLPQGAPWGQEPQVLSLTLRKPLRRGMGLSIVAARGSGQAHLGIYIKSIVQGGAAEQDGTLSAGDQLLSVDGQSVVGVNQERAAGIMVQTGPVVTLQVAKHAASYHGLEALINESRSAHNTGDRGPGRCGLPGLRPERPTQPGAGGGPRRQQQQQRNRPLYRSNPDVNCRGEEPPPPEGSVDKGAAVSTLNLCSETFRREYLTLPSSGHPDHRSSDRSQQTLRIPLGPPARRQSPHMRTFMRQALSQENLCLDTYSSFPLRPSVSSHGLLSKPPTQNQTPTKPHTPTQHQTHTQHETPTQHQTHTQHETPTQHQTHTQHETPTQHQTHTQHETPTQHQTHTQHETPTQHQTHTQHETRTQHQTHTQHETPTQHKTHTQHETPTQHQTPTQPQNPENRGVKSAAGVWRTPPSRMSGPPPTQPIRIQRPTVRAEAQPGVPLSTFQPGNTRASAARPAQSGSQNGSAPHPRPVSSSNTTQRNATTGQSQHNSSGPQRTAAGLPAPRHVSFQNPLPGREPPPPPPGEKGERLSPDPWRREAHKEHWRRRELELLEREVKELGAKACRSPGESQRLRGLTLEWHFQRRLQEEEEEEEEEEEDTHLTENRLLRDKNQVKEHQTTQVSEPEAQWKTTAVHCQVSVAVMYESRMKRPEAPEKLPFKERQQLFCLGTDSPSKVKVF